MSTRKCLLGILFCLLVFTCNLFSQIVLEGTVSTPGMNPEPVQNALVELIDQADTTRILSSTTDVKGHYSIQISETGIGDITTQKPGAFNLYQNYPNPFNPTTVITYELPHPADVRIEVFNVLGQKIKTLFDGFQTSSFGRVIWDGTNDSGQGVSAGVYIYSLSGEGIRINKKMLLIDGHTGEYNISNSMMPVITGPGQLNKTMSTNYYLRVSGDSLSTVQHTLVVTDNMTHDISIYRTMTDQEGNVYKTVKIGNQWWMAENLKTTKYRNGDNIDHVTGNSQWEGLTTGAYCYYDNNSSYAADYGALYNWYAVNDSRNIAPAGWHVPTDEEWKQLEMYLGMSQNEADNTGWRGTNEGGKLKETGTIEDGTGLWYAPNTGATNESGFTARPGGYRFGSGYFYSMGYLAYYWSATRYGNIDAWYRGLRYYYDDVRRYGTSKRLGFSIRLVRGGTANTPPTASFTVTPSSGPTTTTFNFNASGCTDNEDATTVLQVRWDWENDGNWDTNYSTTKTAMHKYSTEGTKTIKLQVKDTAGLTHTTTRQITVKNETVETGTLTDIDGNVYKTVKIGNQWWMAENLKVTHYRNGDAIPNVTSNLVWERLTTGAYCYYNNYSNFAADYGALYNWYAVTDSRSIAPEGWHVPTDEEWKQLEMFLGMSQNEADATGSRGTNEGGKLKESWYDHWDGPNTGATNESGFTARPGGFRDYDGRFYDMGDGWGAYFWSSTENSNLDAWARHLSCGSACVFRSGYINQDGFSIRLVRD